MARLRYNSWFEGVEILLAIYLLMKYFKELQGKAKSVNQTQHSITVNTCTGDYSIELKDICF